MCQAFHPSRDEYRRLTQKSHYQICSKNQAGKKATPHSISRMAADSIAGAICAPVPHRQLVFTIPKRLRLARRFDRRLLGKLARCAWLATRDVYRQALGRNDVTPGLIAGIQTFGELIHFHPHIHALVSDGVEMIRVDQRLWRKESLLVLYAEGIP